ncbi:hypothetical protein N9H39_09975 [Gammaproteobacteria bacterium]|nr:hypothetical protein [Gammaproteobacteria bacterium]
MYSIEFLRCYFYSHTIKIIGLVLMGMLLLMLAVPADGAPPPACPAHPPPVSDAGDGGKYFLETDRMFFKSTCPSTHAWLDRDKLTEKNS